MERYVKTGRMKRICNYYISFLNVLFPFEGYFIVCKVTDLIEFENDEKNTLKSWKINRIKFANQNVYR